MHSVNNTTMFCIYFFHSVHSELSIQYFYWMHFMFLTQYSAIQTLLINIHFHCWRLFSGVFATLPTAYYIRLFCLSVWASILMHQNYETVEQISINFNARDLIETYFWLKSEKKICCLFSSSHKPDTSLNMLPNCSCVIRKSCCIVMFNYIFTLPLFL